MIRFGPSPGPRPRMAFPQLMRARSGQRHIDALCVPNFNQRMYLVGGNKHPLSGGGRELLTFLHSRRPGTADRLVQGLPASGGADPTEVVARYGADTSALDWRAARLFSVRCPRGRFGDRDRPPIAYPTEHSSSSRTKINVVPVTIGRWRRRCLSDMQRYPGAQCCDQCRAAGQGLPERH